MARRRKVNKKRETVEVIKRPIRVRRYKEYFLIVCEDEKTEPAYFNKFKEEFPERTMYLSCIGTGRDQLGVVQEAVKERALLQELAQKEIDHTWVVFDKDDADFNPTRVARFQEAYQTAQHEKINIALSNEVFELWFLLHFMGVDPEYVLARQTIYHLLNQAINNHLSSLGLDFEFVYDHGNLLVVDYIFRYGDENAAIKRAKALRAKFAHLNRIDANPSTDVDILVTALRSWIEFYKYDSKKS